MICRVDDNGPLLLVGRAVRYYFIFDLCLYTEMR